MFTFQQWLNDFLVKAAGHKYIKRIPYQSGGRLRYRYIYNVTHTHAGKHVLDPDHMKVGTKLMLDATPGKEMHAHIVSVNGDQVIFEYDDGPHKGKLSRPMSKQALAAELDKVHGISDKLNTARAKQKAVVDKLKERGASDKQIAREQKRLDALGGDREGATPSPSEQENTPTRTANEEARREAIGSRASAIAYALDNADIFREVGRDRRIVGLAPAPQRGGDRMINAFRRLPADLLSDFDGDTRRDLIQHILNAEPTADELKATVAEWITSFVDAREKAAPAHTALVKEKYVGATYSELDQLLSPNGMNSAGMTSIASLNERKDPGGRLYRHLIDRASPLIQLPSDLDRRVRVYRAEHGIRGAYQKGESINDMIGELASAYSTSRDVKANEAEIKDTLTRFMSPAIDYALSVLTDDEPLQNKIKETLSTLDDIKKSSEKRARIQWRPSPEQSAMLSMATDPQALEREFREQHQVLFVDNPTRRAKAVDVARKEYEKQANAILASADRSEDAMRAALTKHAFYLGINPSEKGRPHIKQMARWSSEIRDALIEQKIKERGLT